MEQFKKDRNEALKSRDIHKVKEFALRYGIKLSDEQIKRFIEEQNIWD